MTRKQVLAEIQKVSGEPTRLRELRDVLPAARTQRSATGESWAAAGAAGQAGGTGAGALVAPRPLSFTDQRQVLIDQALLMLEEVYAHLALKRALHGIDPVQRLRLLRLRQEGLDEREFQSEMIDIFIGLRDLHTNYTLPSDYWPNFAFLPFRVEEYYVAHERNYLVSWVSPVNTDRNLKPEVEITHWNGSPIDLAVARNAAREAGSNPDARRARGLEALTLRWFGASLPPDEDWVTLTFKEGAQTRESRVEWKVVKREDLVQLLSSTPGTAGANAGRLGLDVKTELLRRVRKALFDAPALKAESEMATHRSRARRGAPRADVSVMPDVYPRFGPVTTPSGAFGYIRLTTFAPPGDDVDGAVREFVRILRTLPPAGLILDVRGNGGGFINFGEQLLQTLTPRPIVPEPFHFMATPLTLRITQSADWLTEWAAPLATALSTGAGFSQGFPLTDPAECNSIGQVYQGPVVLVTDAFCYSTTDIFTAGFQDHQIGTILGCHDNTGAGGANVWDYADVLEQLNVTPNPFVPLPGGAGFRVAIRRSTRVGHQSGVPLEDLGVVPDERYFLTRADLLKHNVDLIARAAQILATKPTQQLRLAPVGAPPVTRIRVTSENIDRVDVRIDDRPVLSQDVTRSAMTITLPKPVAAGGQATATGYRRGELVVSARLEI
ncbi:MAG: S41 family peptidase [Acidobacteriota bacterium]